MVAAEPDEAQVTQLTKTVERLEKRVQELSRKRERSEGDKKSSKGDGKQPETRKCYNCGIQGHLAADCRKPKKPKNEGNGEGRPDTQ